MSRIKVTVTLEDSLVAELDRLSDQKRQSRSRLVEDAIRLWRKWQQQKELIEGYRAMSNEDGMTAEAQLHAGWEIIK